jgi:hypothetical protein
MRPTVSILSSKIHVAANPLFKPFPSVVRKEIGPAVADEAFRQVATLGASSPSAPQTAGVAERFLADFASSRAALSGPSGAIEAGKIGKRAAPAGGPGSRPYRVRLRQADFGRHVRGQPMRRPIISNGLARRRFQPNASAARSSAPSRDARTSRPGSAGGAAQTRHNFARQIRASVTDM